MTFVLAIFFSIEKKKVITFLAHISGQVKYTELKLLKLYRKLGFWLEGQLVLCVAIGIGVRIGLQAIAIFGIDLPNKFTLALISGLVEFIPYLGPFMGMFPALLLGIAAYGWK
ncbi:MAG: AI-2E family transporter [Candidatus Peribacteria bacterium]|nr:MAG: AI-2E family transporter [Candidatus Peribacteria bacterium]